MKMADVLHSIADMLDKQQGGEETGQSNQAELTPVELDKPEDNDVEVTGVMVPPLQAKLELLKKATGVDNVYDNEEPDELDAIKKLTGIQAVIQNVAGEDNDITG